MLRRRQSSSRRLGALALALFFAACVLAAPAAAALPDGRAWEMVSPVDKNGGQVDPPGTIAGGGVLQAAAAGGVVTFSSKTSFGPDAAGAPPASQYVATRGGGGWEVRNITVPVLSGTFDPFDGGAPYQLFSPDLARALLLNGDHCRDEASSCAVANQPLPGSGAPSGYQNYYLREGAAFQALLRAADVAGLDPAAFDVSFAGASPDLRTVVLSSCSALTVDAVDGCAGGAANLYKWTHGSAGLSLVNDAPGAALAAQGGAVSADGARVYWRDLSSGNLYLRSAGGNVRVDEAAGGGGTFEAASPDGAVAFYTKAGHLWRYSGGGSVDLTPGGGVQGVLGASEDGSTVYYQDAGGLRSWRGGITATVAPGAAADPSTYPPTTGRARVSASGDQLLFVSEQSLTGFDNTDLHSGLPDSQVFLYDATTGKLVCVSCNRRGKRPIGPSTIPGAQPNGTAPGSAFSYKPRVLSADGQRVFFDSEDALVSGDSNSDPTSGAGIPDVYEWEAQGVGGCASGSGCQAILSSGASPAGATFADASADGSDAFFLTGASLVGVDPGGIDLYDARVGGGFPEPAAAIPCEGDACQVLPDAPPDPSLATLAEGLGNPPVAYRRYCRKGFVKRKGTCVKKRRKHHRHHGKGRKR